MMKYFFLSAEEVTGKGMRERGSDTQQRDPGRESNPGPSHKKPRYMGHPLPPLCMFFDRLCSLLEEL